MCLYSNAKACILLLTPFPNLFHGRFMRVPISWKILTCAYFMEDSYLFLFDLCCSNYICVAVLLNIFLCYFYVDSTIE